MWTEDELKSVRADLLAQLRELDHDGANDGGPRHHTPGDGDEVPEVDDSTEADELAARSVDADVTFRMNEVESHLRVEVADALARLDKGRYGVCENCGKRITKQRLRALSHARFCMPCARASKLAD